MVGDKSTAMSSVWGLLEPKQESRGEFICLTHQGSNPAVDFHLQLLHGLICWFPEGWATGKADPGLRSSLAARAVLITLPFAPAQCLTCCPHLSDSLRVFQECPDSEEDGGAILTPLFPQHLSGNRAGPSECCSVGWQEGEISWSWVSSESWL